MRTFSQILPDHVTYMDIFEKEPNPHDEYMHWEMKFLMTEQTLSSIEKTVAVLNIM